MTALTQYKVERVVIGTGRRERLSSAAKTREVSLEKVAFELALKAGEGGRGPWKRRTCFHSPAPSTTGFRSPASPRASHSPVHDDVHVAAVALEAGAQQDVVPASEADLHGVVGHHLGVRLQHGLQLQQGLFGLLSALGPGWERGWNPDLRKGPLKMFHEAQHGLQEAPSSWRLLLKSSRKQRATSCSCPSPQDPRPIGSSSLATAVPRPWPPLLQTGSSHSDAKIPTFSNSPALRVWWPQPLNTDRGIP